MLTVADSAQQGFFDSSWCGNVVPRDSFFGLLAEHGERIVCDGDFAECYAEGRGRPSIPPSMLAKILLLAYRCGLSDRQAMEAVRFDLRWKVALGLPLDHEGFPAPAGAPERARRRCQRAARPSRRCRSPTASVPPRREARARPPPA